MYARHALMTFDEQLGVMRRRGTISFVKVVNTVCVHVLRRLLLGCAAVTVTYDGHIAKWLGCCAACRRVVLCKICHQLPELERSLPLELQTTEVVANLFWMFISMCQKVAQLCLPFHRLFQPHDILAACHCSFYLGSLGGSVRSRPVTAS